MTILTYFFIALFGINSSTIVPSNINTIICITHSETKLIYVTYLNNNGILLARMMITIHKKNMNVTVIKQAKIYKIYLLIISRPAMIGLLPSGRSKAAASLYTKEIATILIAGKTAMTT